MKWLTLLYIIALIIIGIAIIIYSMAIAEDKRKTVWESLSFYTQAYFDNSFSDMNVFFIL